MRNMMGAALMCGAAIGVLTLASTATAAEAEQAATAQQGDVDEVVVTAQKRSERLQDVPLSVTAITERSIEAQGIDSFGDYIVRTPGLRLSEDSTQSTFTVRGISSTTSADTTSATAGIYIDDYPVYDTWFRFASPDVRIFDVERIEVLRGPQGTLYGATSLSGSIRIITAKANLGDFGAKLELSGATTDGGDGSYALNGMVNIPLIQDRLAVRAVGYVRQDGGYIDNVTRGESNVNTKEVYGGRLYVGADLGGGWNLLGSVFYQHDLAKDQGASYYFPPAGRSTTDFNSVLPTRIESEYLVGSLVIDKDIGDGNLNLSATWAYSASDNVGDGTPIPSLLGLPIATPFYQPSRSRSQTLEARYSSDPTQSFRYVIGAYFNSRYRTLEQNAYQPALIPFVGTDRIYEVYANQRATETAVFGEATWAFAPEWEATVGLRLFTNSYDFQSSVSGLINSFVTPLVPSLSDLESDSSSATPRFSLSYKPNRDLNLYVTVSQGYRFGLTNYNSGATAGVPLVYKSDTLWNYEVGAKVSFLDGRATLNTALYYMDWRDIQTSFRNTSGQVYITNAGDARSYGIESELLFRPDDRWEINAALTLGTAELTTDNPGIVRRAASIRGPAILGVKAGDDLPGSQNVSATLGVQYNVGTVLGGEVYLRADDIYVGESYVDFQKQGSLKIGGYNLVNLRASYSRDDYEIALFAENVFNSDGIVNAVPNGDISNGTDWAYRLRPRTVGVTLRATF